jgi:hypothetical protein
MIVVVVSISAGFVAWFGPVHHADSLLQRIVNSRPGVTGAKQIEDIEQQGLIRRIPSGCVGGFASSLSEDGNQSIKTDWADICYSFVFRNRVLSALHLAPPTGIYGTLTVRNGVLHLIRLSYQRDRLFLNVFDQACDSCNPDGSGYLVEKKLNGPTGVPGNLYVFLTRSSTRAQRENAYALNLKLMGAIGSARDGRDLNMALWSSK